MLQNSPMALRCLKAALNADEVRQVCRGWQDATTPFYMTEEEEAAGTPSTRNVSRLQQIQTESVMQRGGFTAGRYRWTQVWFCASGG
ncbi:hypothetical protein ACNKHQ_13480 [Shigella flexneri]